MALSTHAKLSKFKGLDSYVSEAYRISKEHGFHDRDNTPKASTLEDRVALIHTEVSEAFEEIRAGGSLTEWRCGPGGKPEGFPIEIADVCIRLFDLAGSYGLSLASEFEVYFWKFAFDAEMFRAMPLGEVINKLHERANFIRHSSYNELAQDIVHVIEEVVMACFALGIDIDEAVRVKMEYNETREHMHGKKF